MREELRHVRRFLGRVSTGDPEPSIPPYLPPGRIEVLEGRGEVLIREQEGPPDAVPVLLLHGWTASADTTFFAAYPALQGRHRVIALDHRGHGRGIRSEEPFSLEDCADDAVALLDLLGIERTIVVGYSMGGAIGLLLWHRHPERVAGLVMQATSLEWRSTFFEKAMWRFMTVFDVSMRLGTGEGFIQRYLRLAVEDNPDVAPLKGWVAGEFRRGHPGSLASAGRRLADFDGRPFASSCTLPCASVITTRDRLVRAKKQRQLARAMNCKVFEIDADHDGPLVRAKEFADATADAVAHVASGAR